jgi:NAD(P)-dependent dehydrogenase (short-subunit alcohol dehydrogenase family)
MSDFDGLVAAVTGGASGIGAATVDVLTGRGATVVSLDLATGCDVRDSASVEAAIAAVVDRHGRLDVLVNNAGIGAVGDVTANDDDEWHRVLDVNVVGMARVSRAALPHLRNSPSAAIVNTCSIVVQVGIPQRALYAASKGAVGALTLAMAADHVKEGVRVNAVVPGTADTPWVGRLLDAADDPAAARTALVGRQPMGRLVSADEVANAIAYLASPLSSATTGTLLAVDAGVIGVRLPR